MSHHLQSHRIVRVFALFLLLALIAGIFVIPVFAQPEGFLQISGTPLTIQVGENASIQVYHESYTHGATYGTADSGFFLVIGNDLYGPDLENTNQYSIGPATLRLDLVSHAGPLGSGSEANPYRITTVQELHGSGANLGVVQNVEYVNGKQFFQQTWQITNNGTSEVCFKAYHAADIYFADDDLGYGYYNASTGSVGGFNQGQDWFMVFTPLTPADHYQEDHFGMIWYAVEYMEDLEDAISTDYEDNGIGLQWNKCLPAGQEITLGDRWSFGESEAAVLGAEVGKGYRPAGPLVPEITTYIPTPLDLSVKPAVIGTNLLLAALMMLPFAVAVEIFTRTLAENEASLQRKIRPLGWFARFQERFAQFFMRRVGKNSLGDVLKVSGVMVFYGLVFSLLDKTWNPFSLKGLILFGSMTVAYGLVGVADDIVQWLRIRRWGLVAELKVRPTNILLAALSTTASRLLSLVPGLMFGTPEALDTDETQFDESKRNKLLWISAITFVVIGLIVWVPTIATDLIQRSGILSSSNNDLLGGIESILLVIFAVALENLFVQMLGFRGSFGYALKRKSRWLWIILLILVTFIFYHTLINPHGELASALQQGNVLLLIGVVVIFILITLIMRLVLLSRQRRAALAVQATQAGLPAQVVPPASATVLPKTISQVSPMVANPLPLATAPTTNAPVSGEKQCPSCGQTIKAQAQLCRFCRATFSVTLQGYCLIDHDVVPVTEAGKCSRCGAEPVDIHVESRLLQPSPSIPMTPEPSGNPVQIGTSSSIPEVGTKKCPACGQTIKAEARMCRFCRAQLA